MKTSLVSNHSVLKAQHSSQQVKRKIDKNLQKLSTGKRVNSAADDAAGLSIAAKLRSQVGSQQMAMRNASQAASFVQFAESSLTTIHEALTRLNEIAVYNASDTISSDERRMNNEEFMALKDEIRRIVAGTKMYERKTLDGSIREMKIHVGTSSGKESQITVNTKMFSATLDALGIHDITADTRQRSLKSLRKFNYAIHEVANARAYYGTVGSILVSAQGSLDHNMTNTSNAYGRIMDTDLARQATELAKNKVIQDSATSVQVQTKNQNKSAARLVENGGVPPSRRR